MKTSRRSLFKRALGGVGVLVGAEAAVEAAQPELIAAFDPAFSPDSMIVSFWSVEEDGSISMSAVPSKECRVKLNQWLKEVPA